MEWFLAEVVLRQAGVKELPATEGERQWLCRVVEAWQRNPRLSLVDHLLDPLHALEWR